MSHTQQLLGYKVELPDEAMKTLHLACFMVPPCRMVAGA